MSVGALLAFPFDSDQAPFSEQDLWTLAGEAVKEWDAFDEGMPKGFAEYLVNGAYYPPNWSSENQSSSSTGPKVDQVQVQVGALSKTLNVTGMRQWQKLTGSSEPLPLDILPISYEFAYGGAGFDQNPVGMGRDEALIPQIEHPDSRFSHPKTEVVPAGFSARNIDWQPRKSLWGTYNERWQQNDAPGFARDIQWQIFQLAPEDQWSKSSQWQGGEPIKVRNMHPELRLLEGKLPSIRVRCFVLKHDNLHEVSTKFETVWLYPSDSAQICAYRGQFALETFDGKEVDGLLVAYEMNENKSIEHYAAVMASQVNPPEDGALFDDNALRPDNRALSVLRPVPAVEKAEVVLPGAALGLGALAVLAKMKAGKQKATEDAAAASADAKVDQASAPELAATGSSGDTAEQASGASAETISEPANDEDDEESAALMAEVDALLDKMQDQIQLASKLSSETIAQLGVDTSALQTVQSDEQLAEIIDQALPSSAPKASNMLSDGGLEDALAEPQKLAQSVVDEMKKSAALGDANNDLFNAVGGDEALTDALVKQENLAMLKEMPSIDALKDAMDPEVLDQLRKAADPSKGQ